MRLVTAATFLAQNAVVAVVTGGRRVKRDGGISERHGAEHFLVAFIRVKNEARFLPEWVAHHHGLGIEHIYVYDNGSTDDLATSLRPFQERGIVTVVDWPVRPVLPGAFEHFQATYAHQAKWVAWFDADEFVAETRTGELVSLLRSAAPAWPALALNWRYYGSSFYEVVPDGLLTANFVWSDSAPNAHIKVIYQPSQVLKFRNPHNIYYRRGRVARTCDGRRVFGSFVRPKASAMLLNHYVYRSRENYIAKCNNPGSLDADGLGTSGRRIERTDVEFLRHNECQNAMRVDKVEATRALLIDLGFGQGFVGGAEHEPR